MPMHNEDELYAELQRTLVRVNQQIAQVELEASRWPWHSGASEDEGIDPLEMKTKDGNYVMLPLLAAKANCLQGMAVLKASKTTRIVNKR